MCEGEREHEGESVRERESEGGRVCVRDREREAVRERERKGGGDSLENRGRQKGEKKTRFSELEISPVSVLRR